MIIILLGPPGAGKGIIADKINRLVFIPVIATGNILRKAIKAGSDLGEKAKSFVVSGKLVPDEYIMKIVKNRIAESDCEKGFILDGFPRTMNQAKEFELVVKGMNKAIDQVFYFYASYETIISRLSARRVCTKCGAIYNLKYDPPDKIDLCSKCGGKLIQRIDDQEETIKKRVDVYNKETLPLVNYYEKLNILMKINADQDLEDRFKILWNRLIEIGVI